MTMAEGAGFEPALGDYPKHAFQACDLNHSSTSPFDQFAFGSGRAARELLAFCEGAQLTR